MGNINVKWDPSLASNTPNANNIPKYNDRAQLMAMSPDITDESNIVANTSWVSDKIRKHSFGCLSGEVCSYYNTDNTTMGSPIILDLPDTELFIQINCINTQDSDSMVHALLRRSYNLEPINGLDHILYDTKELDLHVTSATVIGRSILVGINNGTIVRFRYSLDGELSSDEIRIGGYDLNLFTHHKLNDSQTHFALTTTDDVSSLICMENCLNNDESISIKQIESFDEIYTSISYTFTDSGDPIVCVCGYNHIRKYLLDASDHSVIKYDTIPYAMNGFNKPQISNILNDGDNTYLYVANGTRIICINLDNNEVMSCIDLDSSVCSIVSVKKSEILITTKGLDASETIMIYRYNKRLDYYTFKHSYDGIVPGTLVANCYPCVLSDTNSDNISIVLTDSRNGYPSYRYELYENMSDSINLLNRKNNSNEEAIADINTELTKKANRYELVPFILEASQWIPYGNNDGVERYVYSFEDEGYSDEYDIEIMLSYAVVFDGVGVARCLTEEEYDAFVDAKIIPADIGTNNIMCTGIIPTIDIPVVLKVVKK